MMRRGIRRVLPARDRWHSLQEYAVGEANQEEFRLLRARDASVTNTIASQSSGDKTIDWAAWGDRISNKETLQCLQDFHAQQSAIIDSVLGEDHKTAVAEQTAGWELFDAAKTSCDGSVQKSQQILRNGARALWISFQNPPVSQLSQTEWLDTDQYWQAFVEKHHYYHNHIASAVEDPESKEYDAKQKAELQKRWQTFDGRGTDRQNNKLLYQRPSFEYYDIYRGPLIEHMIYYLTKTGGDARTFPEVMPTEWFAEIYNERFGIYNVLQRRKRLAHESSLARECSHDFHPHDLEHDGEASVGKLIARESAVTELAMGRLMGNYILFSDNHVPVQTGHALYAALQSDGGRGSFFSLGDDVHALFYKPAAELSTPAPKECLETIFNHATMTGRRFEVGYAAVLEAFGNVLESRRAGLDGNWFTAPGESSSDAFMRRLRRSDPTYPIYEAYAAEHAERWAGAKKLTIEEAMQQIGEVERKYNLECSEYENVLFGLNDEVSAAGKADLEVLTKLHESGELQAQFDSGAYVAVKDGAIVKQAAVIMEDIHAFEATKDKAVDVILATKLPALEQKK